MRQEGHTVLGYIDDCLIIAKSFQECSFATLRLRNLLLSLGFSINEKKSLCVPDQQIVFLGYEIDSRKMTIAPTPQKREKCLKVTDKLLQGKKFKISHRLYCRHKGSEYVPNHFRALENDKIEALRRAGGWGLKAMLRH